MFCVAMDQMLLLLSFMINICWKFDLVWVMIFFYCRREMLVLLSLKQIRLCCFFYFFFLLRVWFLLTVLQLQHNSGTDKKPPLPHLVQVPTELAILTKKAQSCTELMTAPLTRGWISWHFTFPAPKQSIILKETENNSSGSDLKFLPDWCNLLKYHTPHSCSEPPSGLSWQ